MSKTFKSIVAAAAAALTVGVLSIGVAAATPYANDDKYHYYTINVPDYNKSEQTSVASKEDTLDYAVVYFQNGSTVSDTKPLMMRVYKEGLSSAATQMVTATEYGDGNEGRYELPYIDGYGIKGARYHLVFTSGRYGATAHGYWAP